MTTDFFTELRSTPTRVWVNNPTLAEVDRALALGAVGATTNPTFCANLLRREPDEIRPVIEHVAGLSLEEHESLQLIQELAVQRVAERLMPLHVESGGVRGFVAIQGNPELDADAAGIEAEALAALKLAPNVVPKIPATLAGLEAMEALVAGGHPVIITEVFSVDQIVSVNERYLAAIDAGGGPMILACPITGIYGDHLKGQGGTAGNPELARIAGLAGVAVAAKCDEVSSSRGYPARLLAGGSRVQHDLLALVGRDMDVTVNWVTLEELLEEGSERSAAPISPEDQAAMRDAFPEVQISLTEAALTEDEFAGFGPVLHFRDMFVSGWLDLAAEFRAVRSRG